MNYLSQVRYRLHVEGVGVVPPYGGFAATATGQLDSLCRLGLLTAVVEDDVVPEYPPENAAASEDAVVSEEPSAVSPTPKKRGRKKKEVVNG